MHVCVTVIIINFNQPTYSITEDNGPAQPILTLSNPSIFDITLQISDTNGGLSGTYILIYIVIELYLIVIILDDYISGPYEVLFVSGRTDNILNITIVDDNLLEPVESFNLTIDSLSGDATIGNLDNVMISIIDNDGKYGKINCVVSIL